MWHIRDMFVVGVVYVVQYCNILSKKIKNWVYVLVLSSKLYYFFQKRPQFLKQRLRRRRRDLFMLQRDMSCVIFQLRSLGPKYMLERIFSGPFNQRLRGEVPCRTVNIGLWYLSQIEILHGNFGVVHMSQLIRSGLGYLTELDSGWNYTKEDDLGKKERAMAIWIFDRHLKRLGIHSRGATNYTRVQRQTSNHLSSNRFILFLSITAQ